MKTILIVICLVVVGCSPTPTNKPTQTHSEKWGPPSIEIVKVRDCEYVLWYYGYGSDMEHYEGCTNPKHCKL